MSAKIRILIAALSLSASGFVAIVANEGYTDKAIIPTINDKPTIGFGSTVNEDGTPVKLGDTTTPAKALVKAQSHVAKEEQLFRQSLPNVKLSQGEYDLYMDFIYQYGSSTWYKSSMRKHLLKSEYTQACDALLKYKYSGGYDCSIPNNKRCAGVWTRQLERHKKCTDENR